MNKRDINYIKRRIGYIKDSLKLLKQVYNKTKISDLSEVYFEIEGDILDIKWKLESAKWGKE